MEAKTELIWECVVCRKPREVCRDLETFVARCASCGAYQTAGEVERAFCEEVERHRLAVEAVEANARRRRAAFLGEAHDVVGDGTLTPREAANAERRFEEVQSSVILPLNALGQLIARVVDRLANYDDEYGGAIARHEAREAVRHARKADEAARLAWEGFADPGGRVTFGEAADALRRAREAWGEVSKLGAPEGAADSAQAKLPL